MPRLSDLQAQFCDALRSTDAPPPSLLEQLVDDDLAPQRFNVYRNNFLILNGDALGEMYPVVRQLVGEAAFRCLATDYVRRYPPSERSLLLYGEQFADFLSGVPELDTLPYLADVARLEFAWTRAYHAEERAPLNPQQVAAVDPDRFGLTRLVPHPSLHCIRSDYPLYHIWQANQSPDTEEQISLSEGASRVLVIRPGTEVEVREVSLGEICLLERLQSGSTVEAAVCDALDADRRFDLSAFLSRHLFDGTFHAIQINPGGTATTINDEARTP